MNLSYKVYFDKLCSSFLLLWETLVARYIDHDFYFLLATIVINTFITVVIHKYVGASITAKAQSALEDTRFQGLSPYLNRMIFMVIFLFGLYGFNLTLSLNPASGRFLNVICHSLSIILLAKIIFRISKHSLPHAILITGVGAYALIEILGVRQEASKVLNNISLNIADNHISLYSVLSTMVIISLARILLTSLKTKLLTRIHHAESVTGPQKIIIRKSLNISFLTLLWILGMESLGFNFTTLTVFTGAIGLGIGLGLQKIILNVLSGFLILFDRSIKPGDVIALGDTYGWVNALKSRYVSVITRDGIEHLIPNQKFIEDKVENWSYSGPEIRIKVDVGIDYTSDVKVAKQIMLKSAHDHRRTIKKPAPICLIRRFGESSIDMELLFWINDPINGIINVQSDVMEEIWRGFRAHGIIIPFPQRVLTIREPGPSNASPFLKNI